MYLSFTIGLRSAVPRWLCPSLWRNVDRRRWRPPLPPPLPLLFRSDDAGAVCELPAAAVRHDAIKLNICRTIVMIRTLHIVERRYMQRLQNVEQLARDGTDVRRSDTHQSGTAGAASSAASCAFLEAQRSAQHAPPPTCC